LLLTVCNAFHLFHNCDREVVQQCIIQVKNRLP